MAAVSITPIRITSRSCATSTATRGARPDPTGNPSLRQRPRGARHGLQRFDPVETDRFSKQCVRMLQIFRVVARFRAVNVKSNRRSIPKQRAPAQSYWEASQMSLSVLCISWGTTGNLSPVLTAGRQLHRAGHRVRIMADPVMRSEVEAASCASCSAPAAAPSRTACRRCRRASGNGFPSRGPFPCAAPSLRAPSRKHKKARRGGPHRAERKVQSNYFSTKAFSIT